MSVKIIDIRPASKSLINDCYVFRDRSEFYCALETVLFQRQATDIQHCINAQYVLAPRAM